MLQAFLHGVIFTAAMTASLFFWRYWARTKDRLFLLFSLAFGLLSAERLVVTFLASGNEFKVYLIRLLAFVLILVAIIGKNRSGGR